MKRTSFGVAVTVALKDEMAHLISLPSLHVSDTSLRDGTNLDSGPPSVVPPLFRNRQVGSLGSLSTSDRMSHRLHNYVAPDNPQPSSFMMRKSFLTNTRVSEAAVSPRHPWFNCHMTDITSRLGVKRVSRN